jgi:hypothetical protein
VHAILPCHTASVSSHHISPSDHLPVICSLTLSILAQHQKIITKTFRRIQNIDPIKFECDIKASSLCTNPPDTLSDLVELYHTTMKDLLDKHAPLLSKQVKSTETNPWFTTELDQLKHNRRKLEKIWKRTHSQTDLLNLRAATTTYHKAIVHAKQSYYANLIDSNASTPRRLWTTINTLLHRNNVTKLPTEQSPSTLSESFATFFSDKIASLHKSSSQLCPRPLNNQNHHLQLPCSQTFNRYHQMKSQNSSWPLLTNNVNWIPSQQPF